MYKRQTLIGPNGQPFEIQIRTFEMHKTAEYGIAAHWKYKESSDGKVPVDKREEEKLNWLRQILEWQKDMSDNLSLIHICCCNTSCCNFFPCKEFFDFHFSFHIITPFRYRRMKYRRENPN